MLKRLTKPIRKWAKPRRENASLPGAAAWFENKEFTTDWVSGKLPSWNAALAKFRHQQEPVSVLEIGVYEGRSIVAFLNLLPTSTVTGIDIFTSAEVEGRFDRNVAAFPGRVRKIKDRGIRAMDALAAEKRQFDVIYLDTGKQRASCFAHSALAWQLLSVGGILIWDDLRWGLDKPPSERPSQAIELFTKTFSSCIRELHRDAQLIVEKTAEWPA